MDSLDSATEFKDAVKEIELLLSYAKRNKNDFLKYATFNKAAVVLLCGKFEAFIESFLEEYSYYHLSASTNKTLDPDIYEHIIDVLLDNLEISKKNREKRKPIIGELVSLCGDTILDTCSTFKVKAKFNYGKHGENEVKRLLLTFGLSRYDEAENSQDFFDKFNSLNNIRNNIVHQDATPGLTHQDVENYLMAIDKFVENLEIAAIKKVTLFQNVIQREIAD